MDRTPSAPPLHHNTVPTIPVELRTPVSPYREIEKALHLHDNISSPPPLVPFDGPDRLQVKDIACRLLDNEGNGHVRFALRLNAQLFAQEGRKVYISIQGIDSEGFELAEVCLSTWLEPQFPTSVTSQAVLREHLFPRVREWRFKGW